MKVKFLEILKEKRSKLKRNGFFLIFSPVNHHVTPQQVFPPKPCDLQYMTSVFAALVSVLILMLIDSVHRSNQGKLQSSLYQEQMCVHFPYPDFSHSSGGRTAEPSCTFWIYFPRISSVLSPNAYNRCTIGACTRGMDTPNSLNA